MITSRVAYISAQWLYLHLTHLQCSWWRNQMETFSALLAICAGNSPVIGEFPAQKGQWRGAFMYTLTCARINAWVNNREVCDLRRHRAHYDVIAMWCLGKVALIQLFSHMKALIWNEWLTVDCVMWHEHIHFNNGIACFKYLNGLWLCNALFS